MRTELVDAILTQLGVDRPTGDRLTDLRTIYAAWCQAVPFDNRRKIEYFQNNSTGPLPGSTPEDFFGSWLESGFGGTCWAGSGALYQLLLDLGFESTWGIGTMMAAPDIPPNHGTVFTTIDGQLYMTDTSILHHEPLLLDRNRATQIDHPSYGITARPESEKWYIEWRPLDMPQGFTCRIEELAISRDRADALHEVSRTKSRFNSGLYYRILRGESLVGVASGKWIEVDGEGGRMESDRLPL